MTSASTSNKPLSTAGATAHYDRSGCGGARDRRSRREILDLPDVPGIQTPAQLANFKVAHAANVESGRLLLKHMLVLCTE